MRILQVVTFVPVFERVIFEYAVHFRVISGDINQLIFWGYYRSNTTHGNAAVVTMILSV